LPARINDEVVIFELRGLRLVHRHAGWIAQRRTPSSLTPATL
jgi:hypothetical protein